MPILRGGGGLGSHPTPNHVVGKRTVNMTLAKGHHADPGHCYKFSNFTHDCCTQNVLYIIIFVSGEDN